MNHRFHDLWLLTLNQSLRINEHLTTYLTDENNFLNGNGKININKFISRNSTFSLLTNLLKFMKYFYLSFKRKEKYLTSKIFFSNFPILQKILTENHVESHAVCTWNPFDECIRNVMFKHESALYYCIFEDASCLRFHSDLKNETLTGVCTFA